MPPPAPERQRPASRALQAEAASARASKPLALLRPDYEQAELDPENDALVAPPEPVDDCEQKLRALAVTFESASFPLKQKRGNTFTCGAEQVVTFKRGPEGIKYNAPPTFTCRMALAFSRFEQIAQAEARRWLGRDIAKVTHIGTHSCRKMVRFNLVSEHSYGNAVDIKEFTLSDGALVSVKKHFGALAEPPQSKEAKFLRGLASRVYNENVFSVVLTPYWDKLHHDHFHFDLARYRIDGTH